MYTIGIAGGTGSGKTTFVKNIVSLFSEIQLTVISQDSYYFNNEGKTVEEKAALNYDHPNSIEWKLLAEHLQQLKAGNTVQIPDYDYATHMRSDNTKTVQPTELMIVEGILIFTQDNLRNLFDLKIYVDAEADVRLLRRIKRDQEKRGRTFVDISEQYLSTVKPMHEKFVEPSKEFADIIIPKGGKNSNAIDLVVNYIKNRIG